MLKRSAAVGATALLLLASFGAPASAEDGLVSVINGGASGGSADVILNPSDPGSGGAAGGGSSDDSSAGGPSSATRTCTYLGVEIDCTSDQGVWSQERQCFVRQLPVEVTEDSPFQGHADGAVYRCSTPGSAGGGLLGVGAGSSYLFWAPESGAGSPELVDPVTLAQEAIERMRLSAPRIGMTPLGGDLPLLVGMDAWLWIDNADSRSYGPISRTATAGATTVTARATVTKVVWDLGDGTVMTCTSPGTPWTPARGTGPSPTCGHRYQTPSAATASGTFTVRATTHWGVDWTGAGQAGRITFTLTGTREVEVTELQVLQTG